jgi:hypothetical protein
VWLAEMVTRKLDKNKKSAGFKKIIVPFVYQL